MARGNGHTLELLMRVVITLALLVYGFVVRDADPAIGSLVIGAIVGYWLREGEGQARRAYRHARRAQTTTTDDRPDE